MRFSKEDLYGHKNIDKLLGKTAWEKPQMAPPSNGIKITPEVLPEKPRHHKFNISPRIERTCDGIVFDSKWEMRTYQLLKEHNVEFTRQVVFELQPKCVVEGKAFRAINYVADFLIGPPWDNVNLLPTQHVLDAKGCLLDVYLLKRKMFAFRYKRQIVEVKNKKALMVFLSNIKVATSL